MNTKTIPDTDRWEEVKGNDIRVKWDVPGMQIIGKFISITEVPGVNGGISQEAAILTAEGIKKFYLTVDLERKLSPTLVGSEVDITYINEVKTPRGTRMKIYKVLLRKKEAAEDLY